MSLNLQTPLLTLDTSSVNLIKYDVRGVPTVIPTTMSINDLQLALSNRAFMPDSLKALINFCFRFAVIPNDELEAVAPYLGHLALGTGKEKLSLLTQQSLGPDYQ
jgi:hypothetical protein